jgi:hypothetical protein
MRMDNTYNIINPIFWAKEIIHDKNIGWVDKDIANLALRGILMLACGIDPKIVSEFMEKRLREI